MNNKTQLYSCIFILNYNFWLIETSGIHVISQKFLDQHMNVDYRLIRQIYGWREVGQLDIRIIQHSSRNRTQ